MNYFLAWDKVFIGGGFWPIDDYRLTQGLIEDVGTITPKEMKRIENSYDAERVARFCNQAGLELKSPRWQTLITQGIWIY